MQVREAHGTFLGFVLFLRVHMCSPHKSLVPKEDREKKKVLDLEPPHGCWELNQELQKHQVPLTTVFQSPFWPSVSRSYDWLLAWCP